MRGPFQTKVRIEDGRKESAIATANGTPSPSSTLSPTFKGKSLLKGLSQAPFRKASEESANRERKNNRSLGFLKDFEVMPKLYLRETRLCESFRRGGTLSRHRRMVSSTIRNPDTPMAKVLQIT